MNNSQLLVRELEKYKIQFTQDQVDQVLYYMDVVLLENQKINLTAIIDHEEFIIKHIVDSLTMFNSNLEFNNIKVIDIGTGAGFPGVPLKIFYPNIQLTIVDSVQKKLNFISKWSDSIGMDISIIHERAEILGQDLEYREKYDIVLSRAVGNIRILSELCLPLTSVGGYMITSKGPKYDEEIQSAKSAIKTLGGDVDDISIEKIDLSGMERYIISIYKKNTTPKQYPRKPGVPNKNPL